ncbi:HsdM family class I SAM-dependent methyltransferase [Nocardia alni]|uniref:HsdM family class I SAM-dependent methyltransferase n=1 Tax=Nocardia alni TaxID=2815723 RepID=UPI0021121BCC|nr:N-6 DNA methylase [Nocardia alni]
MDSDSQLYKTAQLSSNFGYLAARDSLLFLLGASAEAHVYSDPMAAMVKARQFVERLTELLWAAFAVSGKPGNLSQRIQVLQARGLISDVVSDLFTDVRLTGNSAAHDNLDDKSAALRLVYECYQLGVWFERTISDDRQLPPFVPPALSGNEQATASEQLKRELEAYREELIGIRFTVDEQSMKLDQQSAWIQAESQARSVADHEIHQAIADQAELRELVRSLSDQVSQLTATATKLGTSDIPFDAATLLSRARFSSDRLLAEKLWQIATVLRDEGVSAIDYADQLSLLLTLKVADEQSGSQKARLTVPAHLGWQSLRNLEDENLMGQYSHILHELAQLGNPFTKITEVGKTVRRPTTLRDIIKLIDQHTWSQPAPADGTPDGAFDALLDRFAADVRSGTSQHFTPRPLIDTIVACAAPEPHDTIVDPACGSGGFLISAYEYLEHKYGSALSADQIEHLADGGISGIEFDSKTALLARMNMFLHGIGRVDGGDLIEADNALAARPRRRASLVLSSPPFGMEAWDKQGETTQGHWVTTTNQPVNWVQYVYSLLRIGGRAAIVVPDNFMFASGVGETVRRRLLEECDVHTILRLPTGIFYAAGLKANVLFFDKIARRGGNPATRQLWAYDLRSRGMFTREHPLQHSDLRDFLDMYKPGQPRAFRTESDQFRMFSYEKLSERPQFNLDLVWL